MVAMPELRYALSNTDGTNDLIQFGSGTSYYISSVDFGEGELITNDAGLPRTDGIRFGRDYRGGRLITFEGNIRTTRSHPGSQTAALDLLDLLSSAWDAEDIRHRPGVVMQLRMTRAGRSRIVYGRPRQFASISGRSKSGWIPFTCTFQCVDHVYYSNDEYSTVVQLIPSSTGGLQGDLIGDLVAIDGGAAQSVVNIDGTKPSWLSHIVYGPITNPEIEVIGQYKIRTNGLNIASDQAVEIDPRPWNRYVRRVSDGANFSGVFTASSPSLSSMRIPPGVHEIVLRGNDATGTAYIANKWRNTYGSY